MNVGDEVGNLLFEEVELLLNLVQGVFVITVGNAFVVVIRSLICVVAMRFLRLGIVGCTTRRATDMT